MIFNICAFHVCFMFYIIFIKMNHYYQDRDNSVQVSFISVYRKLIPVLAIYPGLSVCNVDSLVTANKTS